MSDCLLTRLTALTLCRRAAPLGSTCCSTCSSSYSVPQQVLVASASNLISCGTCRQSDLPAQLGVIQPRPQCRSADNSRCSSFTSMQRTLAEKLTCEYRTLCGSVVSQHFFSRGCSDIFLQLMWKFCSISPQVPVSVPDLNGNYLP